MKIFNGKFYQIYNRLKFVKVVDIISIFPMALAFVISIFHNSRKRNIWLICERKTEARDNGYWFYKYMVENHPEINSVYAIDKKAIDYGKVKKLGEVIQFGSLKHWIYYFSAEKNISSQKEGKPNYALCFFLEVVLGFVNNRVYLKHGIIKDAQRWIYYDISKINLILCAAEREYQYIIDNFGYKKNNVKLTGLCRYDNLNSNHKVYKQILVMPTMREWLKTITKETKKYENDNKFSSSEYYSNWYGFLSNKNLWNLLIEENVKLIFYLHSSMQKYSDLFQINNPNIIIAHSNKYDVQDLLKKSALLITDYSSVYFDFAYMKKPVIYFQFDYDKYRSGQYQQGYFSYEKDSFGPIVKTENELVKEVNYLISSKFALEKKYMQKVDKFFAYKDNLNCERTFKAIRDM